LVTKATARRKLYHASAIQFLGMLRHAPTPTARRKDVCDPCPEEEAAHKRARVARGLLLE
jgi:hypothetical protein